MDKNSCFDVKWRLQVDGAQTICIAMPTIFHSTLNELGRFLLPDFGKNIFTLFEVVKLQIWKHQFSRRRGTR